MRKIKRILQTVGPSVLLAILACTIFAMCGCDSGMVHDVPLISPDQQ